MAAAIRPLPRLKKLASEHGISVRAMARIIGRSESYLRRRLGAETYLLDLPIDEIAKLARYFGVPPTQLGG